VSLELFLELNSGWPVLFGTGLLLGYITLLAAERRRHLVWFLPVLLLAAIGYVLVTDFPTSTPLVAPERLGIGVVAVFPAVALSFAAAWSVIRVGAPGWVLVGAPAVTCLMSSPVVGYIAFATICELTGDCL
jgi:hypothetical protein